MDPRVSDCCEHCRKVRKLLADEWSIRRLMTIGSYLGLYDRIAAIYGNRRTT
jgi:hypothetical protein